MNSLCLFLLLWFLLSKNIWLYQINFETNNWPANFVELLVTSCLIFSLLFLLWNCIQCSFHYCFFLLSRPEKSIFFFPSWHIIVLRIVLKFDILFNITIKKESFTKSTLAMLFWKTKKFSRIIIKEGCVASCAILFTMVLKMFHYS